MATEISSDFMLSNVGLGHLPCTVFVTDIAPKCSPGGVEGRGRGWKGEEEQEQEKEKEKKKEKKKEKIMTRSSQLERNGQGQRKKIKRVGAELVRVFAKLNKFQKSKKNWKWVGGSSPRSHLDKTKIGKSSKNKVLRLYTSSLLGGARGASRCAWMQHFIQDSVIL